VVFDAGLMHTDNKSTLNSGKLVQAFNSEECHSTLDFCVTKIVVSRDRTLSKNFRVSPLFHKSEISETSVGSSVIKRATI
jgi:hypothetical protein